MHTPPPPSLWQSKPWWCQPWSIVLTGIVVPGVAWGLSHQLWLVIPLIVGVLVWWFLFLYLVPQQYAQAVKPGSDSP
jgi:hypothetical protein